MVPYEVVKEKIIPVYKELKGWNVSLKGVSKENLPAELNEYIKFLETNFVFQLHWFPPVRIEHKRFFDN